MCFSAFDIIAKNAGGLAEPAASGISFPVHVPAVSHSIQIVSQFAVGSILFPTYLQFICRFPSHLFPDSFLLDRFGITLASQMSHFVTLKIARLRLALE